VARHVSLRGPRSLNFEPQHAYFYGTVVVYTQARNQGGEAPLTPLEKCVGHSLKNLGSSQRNFRPTWCPKVVTGLFIPVYKGERRSLPCYNFAILVILLT